MLQECKRLKVCQLFQWEKTGQKCQVRNDDTINSVEIGLMADQLFKQLSILVILIWTGHLCRENSCLSLEAYWDGLQKDGWMDGWPHLPLIYILRFAFFLHSLTQVIDWPPWFIMY